MKSANLLKELALEKKRNFEDNLNFVRLHAKWLMRTSNRSWSKQQRRIIDEVYKSNRRLKMRIKMGPHRKPRLHGGHLPVM